MSFIADKEILRKLAGKVREIAEHPEMEERKSRWKKLNLLQPERPMVLCSPEGAWCELIPQKSLKCTDETFRAWEYQLRQKVYWWDNIRDDNAIDPWFDLNWSVSDNGYGVDIHENHSVINRGSFKYDHPIKNLEKDLEKLHFRDIAINREETYDRLNLANEIFGNLLPARIKGGFWWTVGLTAEAIKLIGLENLMLYMYDEPENLHKLMSWLSVETLHFINQIEKEGLLSLNNESNYVGSGGVGYTDELPQSDLKECEPVRLKDLWVLGESQETVGISPKMFAEFVLPYQFPILEKFGLVCYGCCEPLHERWKYIKNIPDLRRVSISPWCDQKIMAENLGKDYIFSRKPNPSLVCMSFDESEIRKDIRNTLQITKGQAVEIILKDTHTVQNKPERLTDWVKIALQEVCSI